MYYAEISNIEEVLEEFIKVANRVFGEQLTRLHTYATFSGIN